MNDDSTLLRLYADEKSEAAFAELVNRHVDLVYAVALRRVNGDTQLAQDVVQTVFTDLARKAGPLGRHPALGAWLFRSARFAAAQARRAEKRREGRQQEAYLMEEIAKGAASDPDWNQLRPVLDEVMDELPERDRVAVWLRVCEGRPLAEISAKLAASEDAVRMRVERAMEKLRSSLVKRGIVSTTAALTSALAQEAGVLAPVGLAASVAGTALTNAAAGSALSAALGLSIFMSTTKIGAWSVAAVALLASLAGNAYLLGSSPEAAVKSPASRFEPKLQPKPEARDASLAGLVRTANLAELRDQLRANGADESVIRAMLEGILRRRYREKLSEDRVARARAGWWRDLARGRENPDAPIRLYDDPRLLREMVTVPLEQLLGPDPLVVAEAETRYAFLPEELRQAFGRLDREVPPNFYATGDAKIDAAIEEELARQRRVVEEKRKGLVNSLSPTQRAEWEMRTSPLANRLGRQLEPIGATEAEYRATFPIGEALDKARNTRPPPGIEPMAAIEDAEQQARERLVAAFGYDRALDYIWGGAVEYGAYARISRDANLPASTAGRVMQLAAETAAKAAAVHGDATLNVEQKRAALVALQQSARTELDVLVPPATQQRLIPEAQNWLTDLSQGRYKTIRGALPGVNGLAISFPQSVDNPPPDWIKRAQPLPSRPPVN